MSKEDDLRNLLDYYNLNYRCNNCGNCWLVTFPKGQRARTAICPNCGCREGEKEGGSIHDPYKDKFPIKPRDIWDIDTDPRDHMDLCSNSINGVSSNRDRQACPPKEVLVFTDFNHTHAGPCGEFCL